MSALESDFVEFHRDLQARHALELAMLAEIDRRRDFEVDGYLSTAAWYRATCRVSAGVAREHVRMARALTGMPATSDAFERGDLNHAEARLLTTAWAAHPETFARDEAVLVEAASTLAPFEARRVVDHWRQALDHEAALADAEALHRRRRLHISATFEGMHVIDGALDREGGAVVTSAVNSRSETLDPADSRTPAQRRADALVDICRDYLDHGDTPMSGGEKPHVLVIAELESLEGRAGHRCEIDGIGVIHPEAARRLACDAAVSRIITDPDGMPLDIGRSTRTISSSQRRALIVRDGGCSFTGCDRPHRWCDAHHLVHWADGGPTDLDNLTLLCRRHHRLVHEGRVTLVPAPHTQSRSPSVPQRRPRAAALAGTAAEP